MSNAFTPSRFDGQVVIVTGAGSGIGRASAIRFATEGAKVIASDVFQNRLDELKTDFPDLDFVTVAGDVSLEETAQALLASAGSRVDVQRVLRGEVAGIRLRCRLHGIQARGEWPDKERRGHLWAQGDSRERGCTGSGKNEHRGALQVRVGAGASWPAHGHHSHVGRRRGARRIDHLVASSDASNVNGVILPVDGGWAAI